MRDSFIFYTYFSRNTVRTSVTPWLVEACRESDEGSAAEGKVLYNGHMTTLDKLSIWQKEQAASEGVEAYRVVPFGVLKAIATEMPASDADLLLIKGIGPAKVEKYGADILTICGNAQAAMGNGGVVASKVEAKDVGRQVINKETGEITAEPPHPDPLPQEREQCKESEALGVGEFLSQLNQILGSYFPHVRVRGEVIGFKRNQSGHAYFELKDVSGKGIIRCAVFARSYTLSGVDLADGAEIILTGKPSHHEQYGFSFIGEHIALAGEGALKAAYEKLKKELQQKGLMDQSRKREIPERPGRIGLITSPTGAAIGDFTTNVGNYGYKILFAGASVEGAKAVPEILAALERLAEKDLDVLVLTRGGGSLESLQAFNNPRIIEAITAFPVPVIAGIGHEQDETLSTLVADIGVSTPTAAARAVRASWDAALQQLHSSETQILTHGSTYIAREKERLQSYEHQIEIAFQRAYSSAQEIISTFMQNIDTLGRSIHYGRQNLRSIITHIESLHHRTQLQAQTIIERFSGNMRHMEAGITRSKQDLITYSKNIALNNPLRLLEKGYAITRAPDGTVLRSTTDIEKGQDITVHLADGTLEATVESKKPKQ